MDDGRIKRKNKYVRATYAVLCDRVVAAVLDGRVRTRADIQGLFGGSETTARGIAKRIADQSRICQVSRVPGVMLLLLPPGLGHVAAAREVRRAAAAAKIAKRASAAAQRETWREARLAIRDEEDDGFQFTHRIVPAADSPPLPKLGPASVWDLAA